MLKRPPLQPEGALPGSFDFARQRSEALERIGRLHRKSGHGPIAIALFLALSIAAQQDFAFLPSLPEDIHALLGRPPSPEMISTALVLYSFSSIILILSRMTSGSQRSGGLLHIGYLSAFYAFYHFAAALGDNFWAVFAAGSTVLSLETYHIWTSCSEEIRREQELISQLERKQKAGFDA